MGYREILQASLSEKQKINHRYSMRMFAKKIGLDPSTFSQILRGRRELPVTDVQKIISHLGLTELQQKEFLDSVDSKSVQNSYYDKYLSTPTPLQNVFTESSASEQLVQNFLEENIYGAVLVLMDTVSFTPEIEWMSQRLKKSPIEVAIVWQELQVLGLVELCNGRFIKKHVEIKTSDEIQSASIKKAHAAKLDLAQDALESVELSLRDFTSLTLAVDVQQLKKAKVLIRSFLKQMEELLENKKSTEVYQLNVQLFPLTEAELPKEHL